MTTASRLNEEGEVWHDTRCDGCGCIESDIDDSTAKAWAYGEGHYCGGCAEKADLYEEIRFLRKELKAAQAAGGKDDTRRT
jgi:hypothetical protein